MSREPQPRTSGFSVLEADERGLVRNGLIDSAANWDSHGKQKLRKGYLQTLQAAEDYVTNGPIGQDVASLMRIRELLLIQRQKYLSADTVISSDGIVGDLQLNLDSIEGQSIIWMVTGEVTFDSLDSGSITLTSSLPSESSFWNGQLVNMANGTSTFFNSTGSGSEGPTVTFAAGSNDRMFRFNWFIELLNSPSVLDVNFAFDNAGGAEVKTGSWIESRLTYDSFRDLAINA